VTSKRGAVLIYESTSLPVIHGASDRRVQDATIT